MKAKIKSIKYTCPNCMFDFSIINLDVKSGKCPTCLERVSLHSLRETKTSELESVSVVKQNNLSDYLEQLGYKESDYKDALKEVTSLQFQIQQVISKIVAKHAKT